MHHTNSWNDNVSIQAQAVSEGNEIYQTIHAIAGSFPALFTHLYHLN